MRIKNAANPSQRSNTFFVKNHFDDNKRINYKGPRTEMLQVYAGTVKDLISQK